MLVGWGGGFEMEMEVVSRVCPRSAVTVITASLVLAWSVTSVRCPTRPTTTTTRTTLSPSPTTTPTHQKTQNPISPTATLISKPPLTFQTQSAAVGSRRSNWTDKYLLQKFFF